MSLPVIVAVCGVLERTLNGVQTVCTICPMHVCLCKFNVKCHSNGGAVSWRRKQILHNFEFTGVNFVMYISKADVCSIIKKTEL